MPASARSRAPRRWAARLVLIALSAAAVVSIASADDPQQTATPDSAPHRHPASVKDSPGYVPLVDPESLSAVTGRRMGVPRVSKRFAGGAHGLDDLGRTICRLLSHERQDSLELLCVRQDEFRDILWREFPQSRPATGIHWSDAWFFAMTRNRKGCSQAVRDLAGTTYDLVRVRADSTLRYRNFTLYTRITLTVRGCAGDTLNWDWVRAVVARKGAYKILSLKD